MHRFRRLPASRRPKEMLIDLAALEREYFERRPDSTTRANGSASAPADIAARRCAAHSPKRTSWPSRRRSATTARRRAPTVRCTWARTRMRSPGRPSAPRSKCWPPIGVETIIQRDDGVTPTPVISRAILGPQPRAQGASRRWHRHHAVAQSAGGRRLQVQPDQRRSGRYRRDAVDRGARQRTAARRQCRREAGAASPQPSSADTTHQEDFVLPYVERSAQRRRHGGDSRRRPQAGRRSARRRRGALLGADQRDLRAGHRGRESDRSIRPSRS